MLGNTNDQENEKDLTPVIHPDTWTTGTEPISEKQASELASLTNKAGSDIQPDLSAAGAQIQIDALKQEKKD